MSVAGSLCGVWIDGEGRVRTTVATAEGGREDKIESFRPFAWLAGSTIDPGLPGLTVEPLRGEGAFGYLVHADTLEAYDAFLQRARDSGGTDAVRPIESQYLIQARARLYRDLGFGQLRRCQLDIETSSADGHFSDAAQPEDRVIAIGLRCAGRSRLLMIESPTDEAERRLLAEFNEALAEIDPDTIEGHNLFRFDLDYLRQRCRRFRIACSWGRYGKRQPSAKAD